MINRARDLISGSSSAPSARRYDFTEFGVEGLVDLSVQLSKSLVVVREQRQGGKHTPATVSQRYVDFPTLASALPAPE